MDDLPENPTAVAGGVSRLDDDLLQSILEKLPAKSFASAACVNRSWNTTCSRILSRPKLCSAFSLNPSLQDGINQVVGKVLLVIEHFVDQPKGCGVSLTVGYVPGLKVDVISLPQTKKGDAIDKFVMDISDYSASVSGCNSPEAILMFADSQADKKPVLQKMECAFSKQTIIAGNEGCNCRYGSINKRNATAVCPGKQDPVNDAVALVLANDKSKLNGLGKIEFHFSVGTGVTATGPTYKVASAKMRTCGFSTWLTGRRQGENEILDGQQMLVDIDLEMEMFDFYLYIGVTKRRKCCVGSEKVKHVTSLVYHPVQDADEEYLYVSGVDVKTGDTFRFYAPDPDIALSSNETVSHEIAQLKHKDIVGGFIFSCCGRGFPFFDKPNVDSSPILDNFPGVPVCGMFCGGEIGRGPPIAGKSEGGQEQSFLHVYSSVYLLMSYSPPLHRA